MIKLYNKETNAYIGEISEQELKFLVKELTEETYDDQATLLHTATYTIQFNELGNPIVETDPLGNQTVLLKGVNDDPEIIKQLMYKLLQIRVKPYYLFQTDMTKGTNHFRTPLGKGLDIMRSLIGHISGMAVPTFALDAPGGGGKIPLTPEYIQSLDEDRLYFNNYHGLPCSYPNPDSASYAVDI